MERGVQRASIDLFADAGPVLRAGAPRAAERMIAAICSEVPAYSQPLEGRFGQVLREAVEAAIHRFIETIELQDGDAFASSRRLFYDLGRGEFREGRSLYELLHAYEVAALAALREIKAECDRTGVDPDIVYQLAEAVVEYLTKLSAASGEGYTAESTAAAEVTQAAREDLVKLLTMHSPADPAEFSTAARRARYCVPGRIAALACAGGEPIDLAARVGPDAIGAQIAGLPCVLVPDPECDLSRLTEAVQGADASLGPAVPVLEAAQSWEWARRTLELMQAGTIDEHGLVCAEKHRIALLLNGDQRLVAAMSADRLTPLRAAGNGHRSELAETLLCWLSCRGDVGRTARKLHLHENSIRYRLDKVRELYGDELDDPDACFELQLALRASGVRVPREEDA